MRALLDVNVLIALLDRDHEHHRVARRWLEDNMAHGWATCAITQMGVCYIRRTGSQGRGSHCQCWGLLCNPYIVMVSGTEKRVPRLAVGNILKPERWLASDAEQLRRLCLAKPPNLQSLRKGFTRPSPTEAFGKYVKPSSLMPVRRVNLRRGFFRAKPVQQCFTSQQDSLLCFLATIRQPISRSKAGGC